MIQKAFIAIYEKAMKQSLAVKAVAAFA